MKFWLLSIATGMALCIAPIHASAQEGEAEAQQSAGSEQEVEETRGVRRLGDVIGEGSSEFSMDIPQIDMPVAPVSEQPDVSLPDPVMDDRLQNLMARRAFTPDNPEVEQAFATLFDEAEAEARQALAAGNLELATRFAN